jgi:hypothetical protein
MMGDEIDVARLSAVVIEVAELARRLANGSVARPAARDQLFDAALDVKAELFVDFARQLTVGWRQPKDAA